MPDNRVAQAGFTLIEVIIWMLLTVLLLAALSGIFSTSARAWVYNDRQYNVQQTANLVLNTMTKDLRYGTAYAILSDYSSANSNEAISYRSLKDNNTYIYYVDKTNRRLYRNPGYRSSTAELVPGQISSNSQTLSIEAPAGEQIFSRTGSSSVNIAITITDTEKNQSCTVRTTVTGMDSFLR